ncbi:Basic-leucine zipper domain, partial [Dillenia turbinata]
GSAMNFRSFDDIPPFEGNGGKPPTSFPLARQSSVYSLTFDEFQNTWGGSGKDFGSMNMDELLKNIWAAEETQALPSSTVCAAGSTQGGNIQRQGSLTLPRTLSQKTVDEVWKDWFREGSGAKDVNRAGGLSNLPRRQQTLGEMTLEEFLVRAGVVREDAQPMNTTFFGDLPQTFSNTGLALGFQQRTGNTAVFPNRAAETSTTNPVPNRPPHLSLNVSGVQSSQQQQQQQQQQSQVFPKQSPKVFTSPIQTANNVPVVHRATRPAGVGVGDVSINNQLMQGGGAPSGQMGISGLRTGAVPVAAGSPVNQITSGVIGKSNMDSSSLSSIAPYPINGGTRGRRCSGAVEKVVERRQRRMIKNRESAARSRARKQAYTLELEAEVANLKKMNQELQRKQQEDMEIQSKQLLNETVNQHRGGKRRCLRRTLTGPW